MRWFFKLVAQCKVWLATSVAHLVKPGTLKHHATKQDVIFLSSVSSVKLDVPFSWPSVVVLQVGSTVQTMIGYLCGTVLWSQRLWNIMQQSNKSSVYQAFQASSLMYLFLDQVWWFFKLVAQCKLWLATTVHILWSQWVLNIMQQSNQIICLSSVSSVKLDVPFSWPSVVVLQVGSTVANYDWLPLCTSCEASEYQTSCNKATNHLFIKRFKRQAWCTFFLDQVWWFFKLVAQCKLWLATTVHISWS